MCGPLPAAPQDVYVALYVNICKALLEDDEEWDEGEAIRLCEEAWEGDSRGTGRMTRTMFNDSLFELAGQLTWTR